MSDLGLSAEVTKMKIVGWISVSTPALNTDVIHANENKNIPK